MSSSTPHLSASPTADELAEIQRVSDFWYKHWSWWSFAARRAIKRTFPHSSQDLYRVDATLEPYNDVTDPDVD